MHCNGGLRDCSSLWQDFSTIKQTQRNCNLLSRGHKGNWAGGIDAITSKNLTKNFIFIGPESDHCLPLSLTNSLTDSLTNCCLVNLIDVTLACEDANSKLVDVVTVADEDRVVNNLLQILKLRFGKNAKLLFRL